MTRAAMEVTSGRGNRTTDASYSGGSAGSCAVLLTAWNGSDNESVHVNWRCSMSTYVHSTELVAPTRPLFDEARMAVAGFVARYSGSTRVSVRG